ncbi:MAG: Gfo/Idh/MocA family oxidoreductase [Actinobacteria bacterium]|nr:Gfo/Idh/MocA family oxidoreductase [Actinomycetota bacterium]
MTPVRWGLLGAGFIATRGVGPALHAADGAVVQAVAARDLVRAEALEPVRATTSYADVCEADDVDAVYISLPNDSHREWVEAALAAGKPVLCEKPLGLGSDDVAAMIAAASASDGLLVEASWNRWHPRTRRYAELVSGIAGPLDVRAWFTFAGVPDGNYRLDPARGGGALLDVGCYAVAAALVALGGDVVVESAEQHMGPTGVDLTTTATIASGRGRAQIVGSFEQPESQGLTAVGGGLSVALDHPSFTSWREPSVLRMVEDGVERIEEFPACDAYRLMAEAFSRRVRGEGDPDGDAWVLPLDESLAVAEALDAISRTAVRA